MRQTFVILILILGLMTSNSLAQMGHGMMRGSHMMEEHGMKESDQMIEHGKMMENLKGITRDVSNMMRQLSEIMQEDIAREKRHITSDIIRDIAAEMNRISFVLERDNITEEEMKDMENRIMEIQNHTSDVIKLR